MGLEALDEVTAFVAGILAELLNVGLTRLAARGAVARRGLHANLAWCGQLRAVRLEALQDMPSIVPHARAEPLRVRRAWTLDVGGGSRARACREQQEQCRESHREIPRFHMHLRIDRGLEGF